MIKTPAQFAMLLGASAGIISVITCLLTGLVYGVHIGWIYYLTILVVISITVYFIAYYTLQELIMRRIKLLYRTIHSFKISKGDFPLEMNEDVLGKTEKEVFQWVDSRSQEIKKLQAQEAFRREFIGNLAHELRTPIFSIQGYILTLLEGGLEDEEINRKFLERAHKGVERMTNIIEELDVITKLEANTMKLNLKKVDLVELLKEMVESFEISALDKNINLTFEKKPQEAKYVKCDRDKIGQVLSNLINNALNYANDEGGVIKVRFFDLDENYLVEVADNGPGIKEKYLARVFERFYRVDKSRARHKGGSGLGLSIAKHIIESHNQVIDVRSTYGEGSTFSFTLEKWRG